MSTEYLIQIQQRMSGINGASALQQLAKKIDEATAKYKQLENASVSAAKRLEDVKAKIAVNQAAQAKFVAKQDAGPLGKKDTLEYQKLAAAGAALAAQEARLAAEASKASAALKSQQTTIGGLVTKYGQQKTTDESAAKAAADEAKKKKDAENAAKERQAKLQADFDARSRQISAGGQGENFLKGLKKFDEGGLVGRTAGGLEDMMGALGKMGTAGKIAGAGIAIVVVAAVALTVAVVAGAAALFRYGFAMADAARSQKLLLDANAGGAAAGRELSKTFSSISKETGATSDRLLALRRDLDKAKIAAQDQPAALRAIAQAETALGQEGAAEWVEKIKQGRTRVQELAREVDAKFGGIVKDRMLGLDKQSERMSKNLSNATSGLKIDGALRAVDRLVGLFDEGQVGGMALRQVMSGIVQPMLDGIDKGWPTFERFILGALIGMLEIEIGAKRAGKWINEKLDGAGIGKLVDAADVGKYAMYGLAAVAGLVVVAIAAVAVGIAAIIAPFYGLSKLGEWWGQFWVGVGRKVRDIDWQSVGTAVMDGITLGIWSGASKIENAAIDAMNKAKSGVEKDQKIQSPSKRWEDEIGVQIPAGAARGITKRAPMVAQAVTKMFPPKGKAFGADAGAAVGGASGQPRVPIEVHVHIDGDAPEDFEARVMRGVRQALEEISLELGFLPTGGAT